MSYVIVIPYIWQRDYAECLATLSHNWWTLLPVDNTHKNLGVSRSWNLGIDAIENTDLDWLVVLSTSVRFSPPLWGVDFFEHLDSQHLDIVEAEGVYGWHLIAFSRAVIDRVGRFDENLPIYFNDIDYSVRIQKAFAVDLARDGEAGYHKLRWEKVKVGVTDLGMNRGATHAGIVDPAEVRVEYFTRKWGRHPSDWQADSYQHPFNNPKHPVSYWPQP